MHTIKNIRSANDEIIKFIEIFENFEQELIDAIEKITYNNSSPSYSIHLNKKITSEIFEAYEIPPILISTYARFDYDDIYMQNRICILFSDFIQNILKSKISNILKFAILADLNALGYMFDRSKENFIVNKIIIQDLIYKIIIFKSKLTSAELNVWNSTTPSGLIDGQVLIFSLLTNGLDLPPLSSDRH
jgi:hypothetical protein